jgi:hypothetical protein
MMMHRYKGERRLSKVVQVENTLPARSLDC